jgi:hypothetical protein
METLLVESPFYAHPIEAEDAPPRNLSSPASSESRIIDIRYQEINGRYDVTYHAQMINKVINLQEYANSTVLPTSHQNAVTPIVEKHGLDRIL